MSKSICKPFTSKLIIKTNDTDSKTASLLSSSPPNLYKDIVELVLLCTIDEDAPISSSKIYLAELSTLYAEKWDKNRVDQALFERQRIPNPRNELIVSTAKNALISDDIITETRCLYYLSGCYQRLLQQRDYFKSILSDIQKLFIDHSKTAITLPSMYPDQQLSKQWIDLLIESQNNSLLLEYIDRVNNELVTSMTDEIEVFYKYVFHYMYKVIQPLDYFNSKLSFYISILSNLSQWPILVQIMFRQSHPKTLSDRATINSTISVASGRAFQDTLIGSLLSKSCLPSLPGNPYIFFNQPNSMSEHAIQTTSETVWQLMKTYQDTLTQLFKMFIKNADARSDVLQWIGDCFDENHEKSKKWSSNDPLAAVIFVSDGFLINLTVILLNLAKPFAEPYSPKLLKIDPRYAICQNASVHLTNLYKETPLIKRHKETTDEKCSQATFNFITEIFFMSHFSYSCSVRGLYRKLLKIHGDISKKQTEYKNAVSLEESDSQTTKDLEAQIQNDHTTFLNIKSVLNEPYLMELSNSLLTSTCSWLVHLASSSSDPSSTSNGAEQMSILKMLPLTSKPNPQLSYIPEFIIENIIDFFKYISQFNVRFFQSNESSINEYMYFMLVFMGDINRLANAHLRATLAEALDTIIPDQQDNDEELNRAFPAVVFEECPLIEHLPRVILDVFVSIELTEQAVAFQQKFNCRHPMYNILQYLWKFDKHRLQMKKLATYAERHIEDAEAPLFLRFINLLMNDANFLLDEGLIYMKKLRTHQDMKDSDQWNNMPEMQRQELENTFKSNGQYARYSNIMGIKTLIILNMITQYIQFIFCHPTICERLAAMLNYVLQHLVGPKRRDLKVWGINEYLFDPTKFVTKVTDIYLNFSRYDQFCVAVSNDGMSYNDQLFPQAIEVLQRIKYPPERIAEFQKLSERVKTINAEQKQADDAYDDAPDEYLDPITSILMSDPVMLPSSHKILDRTTIARHLLSDQTDPFNRNPLRMQDVIPQTEFKKLMYLSFIRDLARWIKRFFKVFGITHRSSSAMNRGLALSSTMKNCIRLAGLSGALAICLGAYGSHAMKENTSDELRRLFQLAQTYHLLHSAALLAVPFVSRPHITTPLFLGGLTLFCGPIYYHAIRSDTQFRRITPYGGMLLIAGWLSIAVL
ncbi:unnamed protein product [Rotaria magnacalcarata]